MSSKATVTYLGEATGPTPEMLAAAPYESFGFCVLASAFVLLLASSSALAVKRRAPGAWLTVSGLVVVFAYFIFQNTLAQDAELRYGPWADAVAYIAYGSGAFLISVGYVRLARGLMRGSV